MTKALMMKAGESVGFPDCSVVKNPPANTGDVGSIPALRRSHGEGPIPVFLPEESYGQRSLTGYNPWGRKELNVTEHTCMLVSQFTMDLIGQHAISGWQ